MKKFIYSFLFFIILLNTITYTNASDPYKKDAEEVKKKLEAAGAKVELK